jgi:uncharacterized delta-60 repeat protein
VVLCGLCLVGAALGADQTDRSFGTKGVARTPLPPEARRLASGPLIWDLAPAGNGEMAAAIGDFTEESYIAAARFKGNGALDRRFGEDGFAEAVGISKEGIVTGLGGGQAEAVAAQPDGKVVLAGYQEGIGRSDHRWPLLVRFRADGSFDPRFGEDGEVASKDRSQVGQVLHDVAVQPGGRIIAVGSKDKPKAKPAGLVIAYRPDGKIDRGFGHAGYVLFLARRDPHPPNRYTGLKAIHVLHNGKLLVAGYRHGRLFLAKLTAGGRLDSHFGGGDGEVSIPIPARFGCEPPDCGLMSSIALLPDRRILVQANRPGGYPLLARFLPEGSLDVSFGEGGVVNDSAGKRIEFARSIARQRDGKVIIVGSGRGVGRKKGVPFIFTAARYMPNGGLDRSFGHKGAQSLAFPKANASAGFAALTQPSGRVVAGGGLQIKKAPHSYNYVLLLTRYR